MAAPISKGRMIRKDISRSQKIASLSKESIILFTLLLPHFSSFGKMNGSPYFIKGEVVPLMEWFTVKEIEKCLKEISDNTNVKWFQYQGLWYLHSLNWAEHQELRSDRLGNDDMPDYSRTTPGLLPLEVEVEVKEEVKVQGEGEGILSGKPDPVPYQNILDDMNQTLNRDFHLTGDFKKLVKARWGEGFREPDFHKVFDTMFAKWNNDPKMKQYLRPATLFQAGKFDGYLNAEVSLSDRGIISEGMEKSLSVFEEFAAEIRAEREASNA